MHRFFSEFRINNTQFTIVGLLSLMLFVVVACDRSVVFDEDHHVDEDGWNVADSLVYNFKADDTTQTYLCCFDIRNRNDYPYSNIYLNIKTIYPDGAVAVDTNLQFIFAENDGRWLGRESGRYVDGRYPFCYFKFPQLGAYQFVVTHAMRDDKLPGINNVSFVILRQ